MSVSAKSYRESLRSKGVFYSDLALAEMLKGHIPEGVTEVYDPTCGDGALLSVFPDTVRKYGQELNPEQAALASERLANAVIAEGDTLKAPAFADRRFPAIVANPPFSIRWEPPEDWKADPVFSDAPCVPSASRADFAFLLHILHCLSDDGVAAVLNFPGVCYRGQREGTLRRWMIERNCIDKVILIEGGHFEDTKIATALLVLRKNRTEDFILMRDNEKGIERNVPLSEIESQGYSLSVGSYVFPAEEEKPKPDPRGLEIRARAAAVRKLRAEIDFSKMVAAFEGWPLEPFLDALQGVINEYRDQPKLML